MNECTRMNFALVSLLYSYGIFLILCGVVSVLFIGMKAKTALMSGGLSGALAIVAGYGISQQVAAAQIGGIALSMMLLVVFSWRATKTFFKVFELIPSQNEELKGKGIAFLIISLMAVVSIFVLILQIVWF